MNKKVNPYLLALIFLCILIQGKCQNITTYAGGGVADGLNAVNALLNNPSGTVKDALGNLYIADTQNHRIRKVSVNGIITTIAGTGQSGFSGDNGPATNAVLNSPTDVAIDNNGNIYISEGAHRVRKINSSGIITTVAGDGIPGGSGDNNLAQNARLNQPMSLAADLLGNLFIADYGNNRIRKINASGIISTVAGTGNSSGPLGDNGIALNANLGVGLLFSITIDQNNNLFITNGNRVRKINTSGIITTVAGDGVSGFYGDNGSAINARLKLTRGVDVDQNGNLFIADSDNHRIRKVSQSGVITTVAGGGTGNFNIPATSSSLNFPKNITCSSNGELIISDDGVGYEIIKIVDISGIITKVAGADTPSIYSGDNDMATNATLFSPENIALDGTGNMYITDYYNGRVRKINSAGVITTIAGGGSSINENIQATSAAINPKGIAIDLLGNIYITQDAKIRKINTQGIITTIAGTGISGYSGDNNPAINAMISNITDISLDISGNIYFPDGSRIRKINPAGIITTIAGNGNYGCGGDNGPALSAELRIPTGITVDNNSNSIYISDRGCNCIRKINNSGIITKIAGMGVGPVGNSGDNGPAMNASFNYPEGITMDNSGNIYIVDTQNFIIRKVDTSGIITTIAGNKSNLGPMFGGDGGIATNAYLNYPHGIAVANSGVIFIADTENHRIRKVQANQTITFNPIPNKTCGDIVILSATTSSGLPLSFISSNPSVATIAGNTVTITGVGSSTITASQPGNNDFFAALSVSQVLTINPMPTPVVTSGGPTTFCQGSSVTLSANSGASYLWSTGATTQSISVSTSGNYSVKITNASGCSATSEATSVTVNPAPLDANITANSASICIGQSVTISSSGGSGTPYYWASTNGGQSWNVFAQQYGGQSSFNFTPTQPGTYRFHVRNQNNCGFCWETNTCSTYAYVDVVVNAGPVENSITANTSSICLGQSITISSSDGTGTPYYWASTNGGQSWDVFAQQYGGQSSFNFTPSQAGIYRFHVRTQNGCGFCWDTNTCSVYSYVDVTVSAVPVPTITGSLTTCNGSQTTLTAVPGVSGNFVYQWSNGSTSASVTVGTGTYTVTVSNSANSSCAATATVTVTQGSTVGEIYSSGDLCQDGQVLLIAGSGSSYSWSPGPIGPSSIYVWNPGIFNVSYYNTSGCYVTAVIKVKRSIPNCPIARTTRSTPTPPILSDSLSQSNSEAGQDTELFQLFPSPAYKLLNIRLSAAYPVSCTVDIFDQLGKLAHRSTLEAGETDKQINIADFACGVYIVQLKNHNQLMKKRIIFVGN